MLFDTHAHYDDEAFDEDREAILSSLPENGIKKVINVSASLKTTENTLKLIKEYDYIYGAVGVHPDDTGELNEETFRILETAVKTEKVVAVGEIGLDYYWNKQESEVQKRWFRKQLELAVKRNLPVIIHSRDAAQDTLEIISETWLKVKDEQKSENKLRGVMHCYSYSEETAAKYIEMGFYLGIGGVVTFKNSKKLKQVVKGCPLDRILLETDCPYLAPEPNRGKRNSSLYLPYVIKTIADLKGISESQAEEATFLNAERLFISKSVNLNMNKRG